MRIRWTPAAALDLQHINDYLQEHHPRHQKPTVRKIYSAVQSLKEWPYLGRPGRVLAPLPYIGVHRVRGDNLEVLRIYHGAQDRP